MRQVHDRLVHAPVAVAQLVGVQADGPGQDLAAEADAEQRHARPRARRASRRPRTRPRPGRRGRWRRRPRPGCRPGSPAAVEVAGSTRTSMPRAAMLRGVAALMPRSTAATRYLVAVPDGGATVYGLRRGDDPGQVGAGHARAGQHPVKQRAAGRSPRWRPPPASRRARAAAWSARGCRGWRCR